jgi:glycine oxidase
VFDVLLIGGGAVGLACAAKLAERGLRVGVVERGPLGAEASSAAGGILAPQCEAHGPGAMLDLCLRSRALWPAFARELAATGIDPAYRDDGTVALALDDTDAEALARRIAWQREAGLPVEELTADALHALEPALAPARLAARFPDDHQVDNVRVVQALIQAARRAGVAILATDAHRVVGAHGRVTGVAVDGAVLEAQKVVITAGSWSAQLGANAVKPVRGQMIELAVTPPMRHVVFGDGGYLVPRKDGRLLCGSTEEHTGFDKSVTAEGLERQRVRLARLCPSLAAEPTARSWSGLRPGTPDGLPLLGPGTLEGLFVASGHFRNGILLLPATASIVTDLCTGARPSLDLAPFSPQRFG